LHILGIEVHNRQVTVQDHAEESIDATAIGFDQELGNFCQHRPGRDQSAGKGAGELHGSRMIRVACVDQCEKRAGVSENASRR
jgi:hypothetical protein